MDVNNKNNIYTDYEHTIKLKKIMNVLSLRNNSRKLGYYYILVAKNTPFGEEEIY